MEKKNLDLLRRIKNGDNKAYLELLILNDRAQLAQEFKNTNPEFFRLYEPEFEFNSPEKLAGLIVQKWENGEIIMPKFSFIPAQNEYAEVINRLKMLK